METAKIFYSWQSDLPNSTNRGFIGDVLEKTAKNLQKDDSIEVVPVVDRDILGVTGSPNIPTTIFSKIDEAKVFVGDVSIIKRFKKRSYPNSNVLIELGYAIKSLGWDRVLLVQNVAFGPVGNLPFDLRQRAVITYKLSPNAEPEKKANEKNILKSRLEKDISSILISVEESLPEETSLRERCIDLIKNKDKQGWISVIEETTDSIPDSLVEWKSQWEAKVYSELSVKPQKHDALKAAFTEATDICIPGFIPIFCAVEQGNIDFWEYSLSLIRRLARLEEKIAGGFDHINKIGYSILSVAGAIGIAIAIRQLQLDIIKHWAILKLGIFSNYSNKEYSWIEVHQINWPFVPFSKPIGDPYEFFINYFNKNQELQEFFKDTTQLKKLLLTGNFILSLLEFSNYIKDTKNREDLQKNSSDMHLHFDISPAWSTMERHDFIDQTENLFNDLKQILEFCGLKDKNISLYTEQFWTLWKIWKRRCINYYFMNPFEGSIKMNSLTLPSEPME